MKHILLSFLTLFYCILSFGQAAKKPTIMVVPSDNWCISNNYYTTEADGKKYSDYETAIQNNSDLLMAISKINELMAERGFPLKNLESALKTLKNEAAEDPMLTSKDGSEVAETPIDKLKKVAKADIIMQLTWKVNQTGPKKSITFNLQGLDSYTDKQIAGASGTGAASFASELPVLLEEAVLAHLDQFNSQLQMYFDDMFNNGREASLRIKVFDGWGEDLETEYNGKELTEIIEDWVVEHTVNGRYNLSDATENMMVFEEVRIPLFDEKGNPIDTRKWARELQKLLKTLGVESKVMTKGLGQAQLVLGGK